MLIVRKDRKKQLALQKGKIWNREIKFEPILVLGTYEGLGNGKITLWKPFNKYGVTISRNDHKRKQRKNSNIQKPRRKSQTVTMNKKLVLKILETNNEKSKSIIEKTLNQEELIGGSKTENNIHHSINDTIDGENDLFISNPLSEYPNEQYFIHAQLTTQGDTLQCIFSDLLRTTQTEAVSYPHNLIEYPIHNEGENCESRSNFSSFYSNGNNAYTKNDLMKESDFKNIQDKRIKSDLDNKSNHESIFPNSVIILSKEGNELLESQNLTDYNEENKNYCNQLIKQSESLENIPEKLMKLDFTYSSNNDISSNDVNISSRDYKEENILFEPHKPLDYENQDREYFNHHFANQSEALKHTSGNLLIDHTFNNEDSINNNLIRLTNYNNTQNELFKSISHEEYLDNQRKKESETLDKITDNLGIFDPNNISNNKNILTNNLIKSKRDEEETKLSESQKNKEYASNNLTIKSNVLNNIPDKIRSDLDNVQTIPSVFSDSMIILSQDDIDKKKLFEIHVSEVLKQLPEEFMEKDINNASNIQHISPDNLIEVMNDEEETKLHELQNNKEYMGSDSRNISDKSGLDNRQTIPSVPPDVLITLPKEDKDANNLFETHISTYETNQNIEQVCNKFINLSENFKQIPDRRMDIGKAPNIDNVFPDDLIKLMEDDEEENKLFESQPLSCDTKQNKENIEFIKESKSLKQSLDKIIESNNNNASNIFPDDIIKSIRDDQEQNKLYESHKLTEYEKQHEEYISSRFITEFETSNNDRNELMKSDYNLSNTENSANVIIEFPSDSTVVHTNTSQYPHRHSSAFTSLENIESESDEFFQNIKNSWSLGSSKILLTPSKKSISSENSSASIRYDSKKEDEDTKAVDLTHQNFIKLLDVIDGNLNDIINDNQFPNQKLQENVDTHLNNLRNENRVLEQNIEREREGNLKDSQFSNNTYMKFVILKKSRENQEAILDSSEYIEKNIFTRNRITPRFEDLKYFSQQKTPSKEQHLLAGGIETGNCNIYAETENSHNYGQLDYETRELPEETIAGSNNLTEHQTTENVFIDKNTKTLYENVQNIRGESKQAVSFFTNETQLTSYEEVPSLVPIHSAQKYPNPQIECNNSPLTNLIDTGAMYLEEMREEDLEIKTREKSETQNITIEEKIMNETNRLSLSKGPDNDLSIKSNKNKVVNDNLLYHLVSESNHKIKDYEKTFAEISKRTNEMINKIIRAKNNEELLQLMDHKKNHSEMENSQNSNIGQLSDNRNLKLETSVDKKESKCKFESENNNSIQSTPHGSFKHNVTETYNKDKQESAKEYEQYTFSCSNSGKSVNNVISHATTSCSEYEMPENFRIISEEKEKSSLIMNLKMNQMGTNDSIQRSILNDSSSEENMTVVKDQNTNLYFAKNEAKSPYIPAYSKQKTEHEKKKILQDKFTGYFKKLNFWPKRKSTTSFKSDTSNYEE